MSEFSWTDIKRIFDAQGVPAWIWYPIVWAESRGNPNAVGDNGCSIGLFQLNRCHGQGTGYTVAQLQDPLFNAKLAAQHIGWAWSQLGGATSNLPKTTLAQNVAQKSGHPLTGDFATMVANFISGGQSLGANLGNSAQGIVLQGPGGINMNFGNGSSLGDLFTNFDWSTLDPFNLALIGGGLFIVVLVVISFIFQSETVRKVVVEGGKTAAKVAAVAA